MAIFTKDKANGASREETQAVAGQQVTVISKQAVLEGTLRGSEDVVIDGLVKGSIDLASNLTINSSARVEASVHARSVLIVGTLIGDLSAEQKVELTAGAVVDGNIKAPKIIVAEGARFRGAVDMGSRKPDDPARG